ncbi:MAG: hypothetical protein N3A38_02690 [Planctomycetota bacterium]|nr:hypothetical protein [Planctomycetota bacterium]
MHCFRLRFEPFQPGCIQETCGWIGENRYRALATPSGSGKDRLANFLAARSGSNLTFRLEGSAIWHDLNGDGRFSGKEELHDRNKDMSWGPIPMRLKHPPPDGTEAQYAVFVWKRYSSGDIERGLNFRPPPKASVKDYVAARGGMMRGAIFGHAIELCDDDTNGRYCDLGCDSISIDGKWMPIASTLSLDGILYFIKVAPSGSVVLLAEVPGPYGFIKPYENCKFPPGLEAGGLFLSQGGTTWEVARPKATDGTIGLPPGGYQLSEVFLGGKGAILRMYTGDIKVNVEEGKTVAIPKWGPPLKLDAVADSGPSGIEVSDFKMIGQGGEMYFILDGDVIVTVTAGGTKLYEATVPRNDRGMLTRVRYAPPRGGRYGVFATYASAGGFVVKSEIYTVECRDLGR